MRWFPVLLAVGLTLLPLTAAQDGDNDTTIRPITPSQHSYPPGDVRLCPTHSLLDTNQPLYRMDVLPGGGFDNLRNVDMGQVHYYNYSLCRVSNDGKYLLPDNVFVIPILYSNVERFAEYFDHWDNYTSTTATSINAEAKGLFSIIDGKFSEEYRSVKSHQYREKSKTTRVQIRHKYYTVRLQPDSQLHPTFKARLFDIAANIQNNNTPLANYLAQLLVRDYGTHYLSSVDAGGILAQVDYYHYSSIEETSSSPTKLQASAGVNFFGKLSLKYEHNNSEDDDSEFFSNRTYSQFLTYGGPRLKPPFSVDDWDNGLPNALVAIDRSGSPLHYVITPQTLPELSDITVMGVARTVYKAIHRYYERNTQKGCTIPGSKNFDFQANVNDNSCSSPETNFTFGGIYQTCKKDLSFNGTSRDNLCSPLMQVNPLTGTTSCPSGYMAVPLSSGKATRVRENTVCQERCETCSSWIFWEKPCNCKHQCVKFSYVSAADYDAFWCATLDDDPPTSGYLFGGYYTSARSNPFTGTMSCPQHFLPIRFGEDITVCVSSDYELGSEASIPFAGFQSCHAGNPLAAPRAVRNDSSKWPKACPQTYTQHLVTIDNGCEINFCIVAGSIDQLSLISAVLPPFMKYPENERNVSHSVHLVGAYGQVWSKGENSEWQQDTENAPLEQGSDTSKSSTLSGGAIAGISITVSTLIVGVLVAVAVLACFYRKSKRKKDTGTHSSYAELETDQPN